MKLPLTLLMVVSASAAITSWQGHAISDLRASIHALSERILQTRQALDVEQAGLDQIRTQLKQAKAAAKSNWSDTAEAIGSPLPTPDQEGWWPSNRPYFYMRKELLPTVRFQERSIHEEDLTPEEKAALNGLNLVNVTVPNQVFDGEQLNPAMAALLCLTQDELAVVNQSIAGLIHAAHVIESQRLECLSQPEPTDENGRTVVARLPVLATETGPLAQQRYQDLTEALGPTRGKVLCNRLQDYFNESHDGLGSVAREFLRNGNTLVVRYRDEWGYRFGRFTFDLSSSHTASVRDWPYAHLFGPDGPCKLK